MAAVYSRHEFMSASASIMDVSAFSSGWGECVSGRTQGVVYLFLKLKVHRVH